MPGQPSQWSAEELRPMFEADQPDPEPDILLPGGTSSGFANFTGRFNGTSHAFDRNPCNKNGFRVFVGFAENVRNSTYGGTFVATSGETKSLSTAQSCFEMLKNTGALRAIMVVVLTSLCAFNMLALTAAKHAAGEGAFKFEYVTVTLMQESFKFCIATMCLKIEVWRGTVEPKSNLSLGLLCDFNFLQFGIPGLLYCLDNNFQYVILGFLQPAELAILWNFKIFATTILLNTFMNRQYTKRQWFSMGMLVFGCAATQASDLLAGRGEAGRGALHLHTALGASHSGHISRAVAEFQEAAPTAVVMQQQPSKLVGVGLAFFGSCIAASGNVFCEYLVKDKSEDCIHVQNMQLYFFGILLNLTTLAIKTGTEVDSPIHGEDGFFAGYSGWVWLVIFVGAVNGLAVSVTLKYVDNIAVIFAHALAMIVVAIASSEFFGFELSSSFVIGGFLVMASLYLFYSDDKKGLESN
jgi:UDP-sugar transporter A1/2/3